MNRGVLYALGAAALFGASTLFAKLLLGTSTCTTRTTSTCMISPGTAASRMRIRTGTRRWCTRTRTIPICTIATRTSGAGT